MSVVPRLLRGAADGALAVLLAPTCAACDGLLERPTAGCVCAGCWSSITPLTPPCCRTCGDALASWRTASVTDELCPRCRRAPPAIDICRAVGAYEGSLRGIVHALKYQQRWSVASRLSGLMAATGDRLLDGASCVVPVPLHRKRRRARGFNQAALLARGLGVPVVHALIRVRDTVSQTGLPAARRHANVRGAFALAPLPRWRAFAVPMLRVHDGGGREGDSRLRDPHDIAGACVVLVDDVSTTGATLEACARVLKDGGAREVRALIAARATAGPGA